MPKLRMLEQLDASLRASVRAAKKGTTMRQLAESFWEERQDLLRPLLREWAIEKLLRLLRKHRAAARAEWRAKQPPLFEYLPLRIQGDEGRDVRLVNATYQDLVEYCKALESQQRHRRRRAQELMKVKDPRLTEAIALRDKMRVPARKNPAVTVGQVLGLFEEGLGAISVT